VTAIAATTMSVCAAAAADINGPTGSSVLLFAGTDLWRDGAFLHGGVLWSPGGLDSDGFTGTM
jgi:hypothetical protein